MPLRAARESNRLQANCDRKQRDLSTPPPHWQRAMLGVERRVAGRLEANFKRGAGAGLSRCSERATQETAWPEIFDHQKDANLVKHNLSTGWHHRLRGTQRGWCSCLGPSRHVPSDAHPPRVSFCHRVPPTHFQGLCRWEQGCESAWGSSSRPLGVCADSLHAGTASTMHIPGQDRRSRALLNGNMLCRKATHGLLHPGQG
jgi:hypothetical protein